MNGSSDYFFLIPTDYLRLRAGPGLQYAILAITPPSERLTPLDPALARGQAGQIGEWIRVRDHEGREGYSAAWYLEVIEAAAYPGELPQHAVAGALRALGFRHDPVFQRLPAGEHIITAFGGFGPNNYSYETWARGADYYANLGGLHNGVDFGLPTGTPLYAMDWGTVVHVSQAEGDCPYSAGPYTVIVRHGGVLTLYGHCGSECFVAAGDLVQPAQEIARSGTANGFAHLHLECRRIAPAYIDALEAFAPQASPDLQLLAMYEEFGLREWTPTPDYYLNPAVFFERPLETYGFPPACAIPEDRDDNGYPDRVIRAGASAPVAYSLYSMASFPAACDHFWRGSRVA